MYDIKQYSESLAVRVEGVLAFDTLTYAEADFLGSSVAVYLSDN